jgi:hypothetical protein
MATSWVEGLQRRVGADVVEILASCSRHCH